MGWIQWAIPLIGLAVWILSSLIKNQQDEARRREARKPETADAAQNAQRREPVAPPRKLERPRPPLRPQPAPVQVRPRPERVREPEPVRASRRPPMVQPIEPAPIPQAIVVVPASPTGAAPSPSAARPTSKTVQTLHALLRNRKTLATAFLLTEVLGPPMYKKKAQMFRRNTA